MLEAARSEFARLRGLMIAHQEELDWEYYRIYGLIDNDLTYGGDVPEIALGERAFEIALARRMKDGEETAWFERHGSTPVTEIPSTCPPTTATCCSAAWMPSTPIRTSACWSGRSTSGAGRWSRGTSRCRPH
ncbi:DNA methylase domain protein [Mycobacterium xenopi 3993]|nr:DNA methylase domain protein [Mycobacterium xenopi 3993]